MMRCISAVSLILLGFSLAASAGLTTIVDTTGGSSTLSPYIGGTNGDLTQGEIVGMTWTQTSSYANVNIAVSVRSIDPNHPNVTAYLTTAVGPSATAADVVATATVAAPPNTAPIYPLVTFFSGLSLPAGTYYLILAGDPNAVQGVQNVSDGNATPVLDSGVSLSVTADQFAAEPSSQLGSINASFVPGSSFFFFGRDQNGGRLVVQITSGLMPPTITTSLGASSIPLNGSTSFVISVFNPNSTGLGDVSYTDTYPAGLSVPTLNGAMLNFNCPGFNTTGTTSSELVVHGISLGAGITCTLTATIVGIAAGVQNNTTGVVSSNETGAGSASNTATLNVIAPPTISKAFGSGTIALNASANLTFTITNPSGNPASLSGVSFTDTLPTGLTVISATAAQCGGTLTVTAPVTIALAGATVATGTPCQFSVTVTGAAAGSYTNITGNVSSTNGGTGLTASASINVEAPLTISKAFGSGTIALNASTSLTFTITNPAGNPAASSGVSFTDTLPTGLTVISATTAQCGGTLTITAPVTIALSGATVAVGTPCQFSVTVTGAAAGSYTNITGNVSSTNGGTGNTAIANLTVVSPPSITKSFNPTSVPAGGTSTLTFNITNPNASVALSGVAFTDTFPSGMVVALTPNASNSCGGTVTAVGGAISVSLSGGSIGGAGTCSVSVNVQNNSAGTLNNGVQVTSTNGGTGNTSTASITVIDPPSITKSFGTGSIAVGGSTSLTFTISNPNAGAALSGVDFTDSLPAGLAVSTPNGLTGACGGGTITATEGASSVSLAGATLAGTAICTFSLNVTGVADGVQTNSVTVSASNGGTGNTSSANITVFRVPTIQKTFAAAQIFAGQSTSLTFTIANPNVNLTLTGLEFSDTLPAGLVVANPNGESATCTGTVTAVAASNAISLGGTGATLSPGTSCTVSVNVTAIAAGTWVNTTSTLTSTQATPGTAATAAITVFLALDSSFQVSYAADPSVGESYINIINTGANGASLLGPGFGTAAGNICVNVYAFAPDEQEISCCSCLLTPNSVANLGVNRDLTSTTLTGVVPTSVVIKLVATLAGSSGAGTSCTNSAATEGTPVTGLVAYGTTPQPAGTAYSAVEHTFVPSTLSAGEYASITGRCASILGNGSGFGVCNSCRSGALGSVKQ
jgi:uncharacterized repeat protein (TIGR01451 family)